MAAITETSRVTACHTADQAAARRDAEYNQTAIIAVEALELREEHARHQWEVAEPVGLGAPLFKTVADQVKEFVCPAEGEEVPGAFQSGLVRRDHADERLVDYVLAADPENLTVTLSVGDAVRPFLADGSQWRLITRNGEPVIERATRLEEDCLRWKVTARRGDTFAGLVALLVHAAVAEVG